MSIRVLIRDYPHRTVALTTNDHTLVFRQSHSAAEQNQNQNGSSLVTPPSSNRQDVTPRCMVEFAPRSSLDLDGYRPVSNAEGTLGLITLNNDVFLCAIIGATDVATVRPGETVRRINWVEFYCLNRSDYDHTYGHEPDPSTSDLFSSDDIDYAPGLDQGESTAENPFHALRKLLNGGNFYYSCDFDLTSRLQERADKDALVDIGILDEGLLWNSYMINPLSKFRGRLTEKERKALDQSRMLTLVIRGFVKSLFIPRSSAPLRTVGPSNLPSNLTVISRLSSRRAGTRFNSRGIDDDGNVANFVETETIFWSPAGICFSYVQIRGSVPLFWESTTSLLPGQQKIQITRSSEATQPAFDKHFEQLALAYGAVHIVNLLGASKPAEIELTERYRYHTQRSSLRREGGKNDSSDHHLLRQTEFDFHAETKGAGGYEGARAIRPHLKTSASGFAYFMSEETPNPPASDSEKIPIRRPIILLQQEGVFRVNCLDCLDRTNLVQTMISQMALEGFLTHKSEIASSDFWMRHSSLWADNGDTLSKIYAGTGALKSSFTRHGKMSLAGAIADARKSATRLYVNNFADKGRQNTIDLLLGRLMGQAPVDLYDPVNDYVTAEVLRRAPEYSSSQSIQIWCGTFNLNGRSQGSSEDLSPWLCPKFAQTRPEPEIVAVGFQEIVELSPQQIMSTDPARRINWEDAVKKTLNSNVEGTSSDDYVLLRSGQLVGAALMIFVKTSILHQIKNVEGAIKKTGMSGIAGNKGAVAIRFEYASTSLCFVTAHLAAGFANYEERNRDYKTIDHGLRFQKNRAIENHDSIVWFGDFNYRIGLSDDRARRLVYAGDLDTLYENDQLNIQMVAGMAFQYYSESRITFPPTYRFDVGKDEYDTSEKARIPAWCDRILRRGANLRQLNYDIAPLRFSDHRPVFASFECTVIIVDETVRAALSKKLYDKRKREVGTSHAAAADSTNDRSDTNTEDEADLMGYESIAPNLPPASSDRRKWWLDNDKPSRAEVRPPREGMVPNPRRRTNPFMTEMIGESDWVDVQGPSKPDRSRSRSRAETRRKPEPPPPRKTAKPVAAPTCRRTEDAQVDPVDNDVKIPENASPHAKVRPSLPASGSWSKSSSASTTTLKKMPPVKPNKPLSLASPSDQASTGPIGTTESLTDAKADSTSDISQPNQRALKVGSLLAGEEDIPGSNSRSTFRAEAPQKQCQPPKPISHTPPPRLLSRKHTSSSLGSSSNKSSNHNHYPLEPSPGRSTLKKAPPPQPPTLPRIPTGTSGKFDPKLPSRSRSGGGEGSIPPSSERTFNIPPEIESTPPQPPLLPPRRQITADSDSSVGPPALKPDLMAEEDDGFVSWKPLQPTN